MTQSSKQGLSASFDDMLASSRKQFDDLLDGRRTIAPAPQLPNASVSQATPMPSSPRLATPKGAEDVARFLDGRYGAHGWSWETAERTRDGDEVTVLVKLTLAESGVSKSQFATGHVSGGGTLSGSVGGVSFSAGRMRGGDEAAATEYATAKALRKCSDML